MADDEADEEADEGPVVELGEGASVEGVPLARVTSRLTWGMEHSTVEQRVGDTEIRTPDGPTSLSDVLAEVDEPYFERRQEFEESVREVVGAGPVQTEE
ncbi:DUF5789 family protein [Halococcus dombrowskii]|uniref:DUF5789 family protein n=1 Tax=Halococcus dombrowskii TaxID=179637 RepID=A0AAV3SF25_HALDO|nr:DUF5789 family protein [Halococcus dombrowskii]UOO95056.1 DUF5789 family protein [Halococcus dombrowskii]